MTQAAVDLLNAACFDDGAALGATGVTLFADNQTPIVGELINTTCAVYLVFPS